MPANGTADGANGDWSALLRSAADPIADLNADYLHHNCIVPLRTAGAVVYIGTWNRDLALSTSDDMRSLFVRCPQFVDVAEDEARSAIQRLYGSEAITTESLIADLLDGTNLAQRSDGPIDNLRSLANEPPVVRLVNLFLLEALQDRASDVHLEATASGMAVRYRIDGVLQDAPTPPAHLRAAIVSRLKIMAELDIAETRTPQDGRVRLVLQDRDVDVRVSTVPTMHGESIVLRLLDRGKGVVGLDSLGMSPQVRQQFEEVIGRPHGIVLVTGPTGSGKTTTLYSAVDRICTGRQKILTVEDPVEYELPGINQIPVNPKVGLTFASALRALVRQDPDVMLVGEIRDSETAEIATQAALTGHLVLSTLHTNDAPGAITRLVDLGVPEYLVAGVVEAVLAQRLVRRLCLECRHRVPAPPAFARTIGTPDLEHVWEGRGCSACRNTGFHGRTGIYEFLPMTPAIRDLVGRNPPLSELRQAARAEGMTTLREDGSRHVVEGTTTHGEILRVTV